MYVSPEIVGLTPAGGLGSISPSYVSRLAAHIVWALLFTAFSTQPINAQHSTTVSAGLVLTDVNIVDTHTGKISPRMSIAVENGKITHIGASGTIKAGKSAQTVVATGKFVVPGYWDMHAHVVDGPERVDNLKLLLAFGITGFRQMSGSDELLQDRKENTLMPASDAPELLALPGTILTRANAATAPMGIAEVQKQKAEGADFIKTIDVSPDVFFATLAESKRLGLPYDGHLSTGVPAAKAAAAGMRGIEHLGAQEAMLISCSTDETAIRHAIAEKFMAMAAAGGPLTPPTPAQMRVGVANPLLSRTIADPSFTTQLRHIIATYSETKCRELAATFVTDQTWQTPTLIRLRSAEFGDDPTYTQSEDLRYMQASTRSFWASLGNLYTATISADGKNTLKAWYALQSNVTRLFDEAGVPMMAGSDVGGIWLVPGASLHMEFDQLAAAGIPPLHVLQMTTLNGARFLGREQMSGSIEEGKVADLVVLDGNPIESIQNLHHVNAVLRAGKYYSSDALKNLKKSVQEHVAASQAPARP